MVVPVALWTDIDANAGSAPIFPCWTAPRSTNEVGQPDEQRQAKNTPNRIAPSRIRSDVDVESSIHPGSSARVGARRWSVRSVRRRSRPRRPFGSKEIAARTTTAPQMPHGAFRSFEPVRDADIDENPILPALEQGLSAMRRVGISWEDRARVGRRAQPRIRAPRCCGRDAPKRFVRPWFLIRLPLLRGRLGRPARRARSRSERVKPSTREQTQEVEPCRATSKLA